MAEAPDKYLILAIMSDPKQAYAVRGWAKYLAFLTEDARAEVIERENFPLWLRAGITAELAKGDDNG